MCACVCVLVQLTVRLKDICSMTKEKTARLIPNAIQVCTDAEKVRPMVMSTISLSTRAALQSVTCV